MKDQDYYQEKIELTESQQKAWKSLERAIKKCKKENIYFYQVLETLHGLNGNNVETIDTNVENPGGINSDANCLQFLDYPYVKTSCSFADDDHFVVINQ